MLQPYPQLIEKISKASGLPKEDIDRRVEAKRAKLSGLISKEGAAQIIAAELGINFDKQKVKVNELSGGMKRVNLIGKIIKTFPVKQYKKENREGKIGSFILADDTASIRVVLWDVNHIKLLETGEIKQDDFIEISNANMRESELHLTGFSDIKISSERIDSIKAERQFFEKRLVEIKPGDSLKARAFILQVFEPRFFEVCPECKTKAVQSADGAFCEKHGKIAPVKRALLNMVLDDGSESMRAVLFNEQIDKLGLALEENFLTEREKILGREAWFSGAVRQNKFFNNSELFVEDIQEVDLDSLISNLEKV
jgi:hypothetical protein